MNLLTMKIFPKYLPRDRFLIMQIFLSTKEKRLVSSVSTEPGKITLLKIIAGLEEPDEGKVTLGKQPGSWILFRKTGV